MLEFGEVQRAFMGVILEDLNADLARKKGIENLRGVYVAGLNAGGAAEGAGIKEGDVILSVQGVTVNNLPELQEQIGRYRPGDEVNIEIERNGDLKKVPLVLKNKNGDTRLIRYTESVANDLGAEFSPINDKEKSVYNLESGLKVESIREGKLRNIGIKEGFIITHIGDKKVDSVSDITNALKSEKRGLLIEGIYPNGTRAYYGLGI
ncbi:MAG: PDZ domain-containing protein [Bacteroidia bacterium]